jgi:hypothetical protein
MPKAAPLFAIALFAAPTAACGQQPNDPAYAREVAASVNRDCLNARSQAPNAAFAHHLERLCACTKSKISSTPMSRSDSQQIQYAKIQAASNACLTELGGAPGEKGR